MRLTQLGNQMNDAHPIREILKAKHVRPTELRVSMLSQLFSAERPILLSDFRESFGEVPTSTLYRNLNLLEEFGFIERLNGISGGVRFELTKAYLTPHHHIVCSICGSMLDIQISRDLEYGLSDALRECAGRLRYSYESFQINLVGRCLRC